MALRRGLPVLDVAPLPEPEPAMPPDMVAERPDHSAIIFRPAAVIAAQTTPPSRVMLGSNLGNFPRFVGNFPHFFSSFFRELVIGEALLQQDCPRAFARVARQ
jgi:hypothetical protein